MILSFVRENAIKFAPIPTNPSYLVISYHLKFKLISTTSCNKHNCKYEKPPTSMVANIINECRMWLRMNWQIQLNHVFREQNKVADALAKMPLKSKNDWMFLPQPESELLGFLNDDVLGVPVSHLVCTGI
nr:hypothetical protein JCGZ_03709 [Ipomoea trifida]